MRLAMFRRASESRTGGHWHHLPRRSRLGTALPELPLSTHWPSSRPATMGLERAYLIERLGAARHVAQPPKKCHQAECTLRRLPPAWVLVLLDWSRAEQRPALPRRHVHVHRVCPPYAIRIPMNNRVRPRTNHLNRSFGVAACIASLAVPSRPVWTRAKTLGSASTIFALQPSNLTGR